MIILTLYVVSNMVLFDKSHLGGLGFFDERLQNLFPHVEKQFHWHDVFGGIVFDKLPEHIELVGQTLGLVSQDSVVQLEDVLLADGRLPFDVVVPQLVRFPFSTATANRALVLGPVNKAPKTLQSITHA